MAPSWNSSGMQLMPDLLVREANSLVHLAWGR